MNIAPRLRNLVAIALLSALSAPTLVTAQTFPNRPIKLVVPLAAGGTGDTLARAAGDGMGK